MVSELPRMNVVLLDQFSEAGAAGDFAPNTREA
jgi:hypothetical protein